MRLQKKLRDIYAICLAIEGFTQKRGGTGNAFLFAEQRMVETGV